MACTSPGAEIVAKKVASFVYGWRGASQGAENEIRADDIAPLHSFAFISFLPALQFRKFDKGSPLHSHTCQSCEV